MKKLCESFGIELQYSDIGCNPELLRKLVYENKIVVLKGALLSEVEYLELGRSLGKPTPFVDSNYFHPDHNEIFVVSNQMKNGKKFGMKRVGYYWHSDCSFLEKPLSMTMLHCHMTPDHGGETGFVDMEALYDSLPLELQRKLIDKTATHDSSDRYIVVDSDVGLSLKEIKERDMKLCPAVEHPIVIKHFKTQRKILYINEGFTKKINGLSESESSELLKYVFELVERFPRYLHKWSPGDIVIWDNRSVVHKAFEYVDGDRLMYRIGIQEEAFFCE